ncbi:4-hydroxythreonine-4-phosphate dehydrogenase [soil metagenome]
MIEFVFMLTRDDQTVPDAMAVYDGIRDTDLRYIGFKDIGMSTASLRDLAAAMRADGREVFLEVVSERAEDELRSVSAALEIGVDWLLGGTNADAALGILDQVGPTGTPGRPRYCPFPGRVVGHPSILEGTRDEIAASARELTALPGVDGLDLLAYRWDGDVPALVRDVVSASAGPVIAAGSVDSRERIQDLAAAGAWAFTIGGAIFDGRLPAGPSVREQVDRALEFARAAAGREVVADGA